MGATSACIRCEPIRIQYRYDILTESYVGTNDDSQDEHERTRGNSPQEKHSDECPRCRKDDEPLKPSNAPAYPGSVELSDEGKICNNNGYDHQNNSRLWVEHYRQRGGADERISEASHSGDQSPNEENSSNKDEQFWRHSEYH